MPEHLHPSRGLRQAPAHRCAHTRCRIPHTDGSLPTPSPEGLVAGVGPSERPCCFPGAEGPRLLCSSGSTALRESGLSFAVGYPSLPFAELKPEPKRQGRRPPPASCPTGAGPEVSPHKNNSLTPPHPADSSRTPGRPLPLAGISYTWAVKFGVFLGRR